MKKINILFLSLFVLAACSKDDDNNAADKSGAKAITAFVFAAADNDALTEDIKAEIDEDEKTVTAEFPAGTNITALKPSVTISEDAKVDPGNKEVKNFSDVVVYTVTAEDGTEAKYNVTATVGKSDAKAILEFIFAAEYNDGIYKDVEAEIDEEEKTITAQLPSTVDLTALKPTITLSEKATVNPKEKVSTDFSGAVIYTVTAEDGTETAYTVEVEVIKSDRQVLIDIYNANPNNNLGWDLEDANIANWDGVEINTNSRVTRLTLNDKNLSTVPKSIKNLGELWYLNLEKNELKSIPPAIGYLVGLEWLSLAVNKLTEVPSEIGQLRLLITFRLHQNQLTSIPPEICNLRTGYGSLEVFTNDPGLSCKD
ncbi:DUF5018 domain-containing protein [Flagellimonas sp. 389]|uniref:DUF5018 domain-containing protein n=1 Tax=Flagellimonas sp. 389 TaxID=2835862 RepID=UPI001BD2913B|nr:DUF5018 domain-containing protein [Flagellimonas sp. 389]MBS9462854.1 DUF5018 domain-containing protein [Flagellimonas sp. 389]